MSYPTISPEVDASRVFVEKATQRKKRALSQAELDSRTRYVFNPGRNLWVADRKIGIDHLYRVRLNPVNNWFVPQETHRKYEESGPILEEVPIYAAWIGDELSDVYANRHVVVIDAFIGIAQDVVLEIEQLLIPNQSFPKSTPALMRALDVVKLRLNGDAASGIDADKELLYEIKAIATRINEPELLGLVRQAVNQMLAATENAFVAQTSQLDTAITERQNPEQSGKTFYDIADKETAQLLEREHELVHKQPSMLDALTGLAEGIKGNKQTEAQPQEDKRPKKACPLCAEKILIQAVFCKHCHQHLPKKDDKE